MATVPKTDEEIWRAECAAEDALVAQELTPQQLLRAEAIAMFDYGLDRLAVVSLLGEEAVKAHEEHWKQCAKKVGDDEEAAEIRRRSAAIAALDFAQEAVRVAVLGEAAVQAHEALYGTQNNLASPDSLLLPPPQPSPAQLAYEAERSERAASARAAYARRRHVPLRFHFQHAPLEPEDDEEEAVYSVAVIRQRAAAIAALDLGEGDRADHVAVLGEAVVQAHEALYGTQNNLASPDSLLPPPQPSPAQLAYEAERSESAALARHALYLSLAKMRKTVPDDDESQQGLVEVVVNCGLADCVHTLFHH